MSTADEVQAVLETFLREESASMDRFERLFGARGVEGVAALEAFLDRAGQPADPRRIEQLVADLAHAQFKVRQAASDELAQMPATVIETLEDCRRRSDDPEVTFRLDEAIVAITAADKDLPRFRQRLIELYARHAAELFEQRWPLLVNDPHHRSAMRFLGLGPFEPIWKCFKGRTDDEKLRFLLLRMYCGRRKEAFELLRPYSARQVLTMAAATWWPVEIEPLALDGAYGWTTRAASVEGNVATRLMRLSVKMPDYGNVAERGGWVHFEQWYRATYLFRFPAHVSKEAVGYAETLTEETGSAGLDRPDRYPLGPGRCNTFRGVPKTAALPLARISGAEVLDWHLGARYEWARPLFPPELADQVKFQPNKHPAPEVTGPAGRAMLLTGQRAAATQPDGG